jgi:hypothetical protein
MRRVLPSQVVTVMESLLHPFLSPNTETREGPNAQQAMPASYRGQLEAVLTLMEQVPNELITLHDREYADLIASIAAARNILKRWEMHREPDLIPIPGLSSLNPVVVIHHALARCPDQFPSPGTSELAFLLPDDRRENLRLDISTANRALATGEWKVATVLAGSSVEALLLWALQQQSASIVTSTVSTLVGTSLQRRPPADLERWPLHEYIEVAAALGVISSDTAILARLAKDFRNLIHPGRAARLGQTCDRGTALSAMAAVEHVARNLTP